MSDAQTTPAAIDLGRLSRPDLVQLGAAALVTGSLFLPWYGTQSGNPNANIDGKTGDITGWEAHPVLRWLIVAALISALISAWQTIRAHESSWERGEVASAVAAIITALILVVGVIDRPGEPSGAIHLKVGWFIALGGSLLAVGAANARLMRRRSRRPPGFSRPATTTPRTLVERAGSPWLSPARPAGTRRRRR